MVSINIEVCISKKVYICLFLTYEPHNLYFNVVMFISDNYNGFFSSHKKLSENLTNEKVERPLVLNNNLSCETGLSPTSKTLGTGGGISPPPNLAISSILLAEIFQISKKFL